MKFRKCIIAIVSLTLAVSSVGFPAAGHRSHTSITAAAEDVPLNPGISYENCGDHIEITGYDGSYTYYYGTYIEIPNTIEGLPVTKIRAGAFQGIKHLYKVWLPLYLEEIGDDAFQGCKGLAFVDFPPALRTMSCGSPATMQMRSVSGKQTKGM